MLQWQDGERYEGMWEQGSQSGRGKYTWPGMCVFLFLFFLFLLPPLCARFLHADANNNGEVRHGAPLKINGKRWRVERAVQKTRACVTIIFLAIFLLSLANSQDNKKKFTKPTG